MPLARSLANPIYRQSFEDSIRRYRVAAKVGTGLLRSCPDCGRTMEPRRRYCPPCAALRRKASTLKAVSKHRQKTRLNAF
jgi:uncharacterized OB-fold protein